MVDRGTESEDVAAAAEGAASELLRGGVPERRVEMMQKSGRHTVPQIWIGERHVGGCDDLVELDRKGELDVLLEGGGSQ